MPKPSQGNTTSTWSCLLAPIPLLNHLHLFNPPTFCPPLSAFTPPICTHLCQPPLLNHVCLALIWPSFMLIYTCLFCWSHFGGSERGGSLMVRGEDVAEPYLVVSQCDRLKKWRLYMRKKNNKNYIVMYLWIPMILWYGYMVCHGVLKLTTIPIPTKPMTSNPWGFLYLWQPLLVHFVQHCPWAAGIVLEWNNWVMPSDSLESKSKLSSRSHPAKCFKRPLCGVFVRIDWPFLQEVCHDFCTCPGVSMILRFCGWISSGFTDSAIFPLCRMIIFDVGAKITDLGLRLLILKSSTSRVSFDGDRKSTRLNSSHRR